MNVSLDDHGCTVAAAVTVMLCKVSTGACLREAQIDNNGGGGTPMDQPVRVGSHAMDHSYSQLYVQAPKAALAKNIYHMIYISRKNATYCPKRTKSIFNCINIFRAPKAFGFFSKIY